MTSAKRITIATIAGFLCGVMCWIMGVYVLKMLDAPSGIHIANIIGHRTLTGFVIGISALRMNWAVHGIVLGVITGVLFSMFDAFTGMPFMVTVVILTPTNATWGFLIELVTTKLFKAPSHSSDAQALTSA